MEVVRCEFAKRQNRWFSLTKNHNLSAVYPIAFAESKSHLLLYGLYRISGGELAIFQIDPAGRMLDMGIRLTGEGKDGFAADSLEYFSEWAKEFAPDINISRYER